MRSNRLQLNYDKTEVLWCTTGRRQHQLPTAALLIDGDFVSPTSSVRDMGIYTDADLGRMSQKVACCFAVLRQLRGVRHCVPASTFQSLYGSSSCYFTAGLRQQCHDRPPCLSDEAATDGSQCRCVADLWPSAVLPHLGCAHHPSLASHSRAHQVQCRRSHLQRSPRPCIIAPRTTDLPSRRDLQSSGTRRLVQITSTSFHRQRPRFSGGWPSTLEHFTVGGDVGAVAGDLQATEDLLIHSLSHTRT